MVVFPRGKGRKHAGFQLIQNGYADNLAITSGANTRDTHISAVTVKTGDRHIMLDIPHPTYL